MIISFILMNKCYSRCLLNHPQLAAFGCVIPIVNWICIIKYLKILIDELA